MLTSYTPDGALGLSALIASHDNARAECEGEMDAEILLVEERVTEMETEAEALQKKGN